MKSCPVRREYPGAKSPPVRGALIEMVKKIPRRRVLCGSPPVRGALIEIIVPIRIGSATAVAPREGGVD